MDCPNEITEVVLRILQVGIWQCRALAWSKDSQGCAIEADHVHNLPDLLVDYRPEKLQYYWEVEKPCYQAATHVDGGGQFEPLWQQLELLIPAATVKR